MDPLLESLLAAVEAKPDDVRLRLHVAAQLVDGGEAALALAQVSHVLAAEPGNAQAVELLARATAVLQAGTAGRPEPAASVEPQQAPAEPQRAPVEPQRAPVFDWSAAEEQLGDGTPPPFVGDADLGTLAYDVEKPRITLADVGGMQTVKERLEVSFLLPARQPELRRAYGKSLRGGLLLYGPPGCGKTFVARALAGEIGARLLAIGINDVLDMWLGNSERNLHAIFETARRVAPCILFFDEVDALGQKRSGASSSMRTAVNQLLSEMDDVRDDNEGVFVLGATNHPWDVDSALRRPGRFDRTVFVAPPDAEARAAILKANLRDRPVAGIDLADVARRTEGFSGADVAYLCENATERAMVDSARTGTVRPIGMADVEAALREVRPSTGPWFEVARNVAEFGNDGGEYDELSLYLRSRRRR